MRNKVRDSVSFDIHILSIGVEDEWGTNQVSEQRKEMFSSLPIAKRHFGYHADERLGPKCPSGTLRSSDTP